MKKNCKCNHCNEPIYKKPIELTKFKKHYCNNKCFRLGTQRSQLITCDNCSKVFRKSFANIKKSKKHFCSRPCANKIISYKHGNSIKYRKKALKYFGAFCQNPSCKITESGIQLDEFLLDVDHINNDRSNCELSNLQILCVYCHAIKSRSKIPIKRKRIKGI